MTRLILFDPIIVRVANKGGSKVMLNKKCVGGYPRSTTVTYTPSSRLPARSNEVAD
jgi:hypothetical protein